MVNVQIPKELQPEFNRIVEALYEGDESQAFAAAIRNFVQHELKRLPSGQKFEHLMEKRMEVEKDIEGYSNKEISAAFDKLKARKKKIQEIDLDQIQNDE